MAHDDSAYAVVGTGARAVYHAAAHISHTPTIVDRCRSGFFGSRRRRRAAPCRRNSPPRATTPRRRGGRGSRVGLPRRPGSDLPVEQRPPVNC